MKIANWEIHYFLKDSNGDFLIYTQRISNPVIPRVGERFNVFVNERLVVLRCVEVIHAIGDDQIEVHGEKI